MSCQNIEKCCLPIFHVILPNATKQETKLDKKYSTEQNKTSSLGIKLEDYKDESGLQFIKFDFVIGGQEIKFFSCCFVSLLHRIYPCINRDVANLPMYKQGCS